PGSHPRQLRRLSRPRALPARAALLVVANAVYGREPTTALGRQRTFADRRASLEQSSVRRVRCRRRRVRRRSHGCGIVGAVGCAVGGGGGGGGVGGGRVGARGGRGGVRRIRIVLGGLARRNAYGGDGRAGDHDIAKRFRGHGPGPLG